MHVQYGFDNREFDRALEDMRGRIPDATRLSIVDSMRLVGFAATTKYMENTGAVGAGSSFKPSRKRVSNKLHVRTSRLARSLTDNFSFSGGSISGSRESIRRILQSGDEYVGEYGSSVPYAAIHEFGGTVSPRGRTTNIPARAYLNPALADSQEQIFAIFRSQMDDAMREVR